METIFYGNIEKLSLNETNYRNVLYTTPDEKLQLVTMSLKPNEEIGTETHSADQFIRVESGVGKVIVTANGISESKELSDGIAIIIPGGTVHNIINVSNDKHLKLYTIYTPANHPHGKVEKDKILDGGYKKKRIYYESY